MTRYLSRAALLCCLFALLAACGVALDGVGRAAGPPSRYPLELDVAIGKAYAGNLAGIQRSCTVWLDNGRDEYAIAAVTLRGGREDIAGFQFINTAGWFTMWRDHAPTPAVPAAQRTTVVHLVRQVAARCSSRWAVTVK